MKSLIYILVIVSFIHTSAWAVGHNKNNYSTYDHHKHDHNKHKHDEHNHDDYDHHDEHKHDEYKHHNKHKGYDKSGMMIEYTYKGGIYEGYYVSNGNAPLVVLVHDWDGLTDYEIKRANMLGEQGYTVFAVDLFGKGIRPTQTADKKHQTGLLYKDREKMRGLMDAGLNAAIQAGANSDNAVAMGYCFGGAVVLESARAGAKYQGFATFHGGLSTPEGQDYSQVNAPIIVFHGSADSAIPMSQFADLATRLEQENISHQMITYSGAPHAFTVFGSKRYRKDADLKSWQTFLDFLDEVN